MLMDSEKHIEQLLEKYWNCETSLVEEQELREYFNGQDFPGQMKETAELFQYYEHQKKAPLANADFDAQILRKIKEKEPRGKSIRMFTYVARIAAGLIVVAVAAFLVRQEIRKSYPAEVVDTYSDPKLALEETKKAFMMISKSFGKAQQEAKSINLLNEAEQKIGEKKRVIKKEESTI
jgi:hypothetical protein